MTRSAILFLSSALLTLVMIIVLVMMFVLTIAYRTEAVNLCHVAVGDRTRCEGDLDGWHARVSAPYRALRDLERVLNKLPPEAQPHRDAFRRMVISMGGLCGMDPAVALESAECFNTIRLLSNRR